MGAIAGVLFLFGFLYFLFVFPKETLTLVGVIILLIWAIFYYTVIIPDQQRDQLERQVVVSVNYMKNEKNKEYPLRATIKNNSNKVVTKVTWTLKAYRPGHSTDLADHVDYWSDKILQPGEGYTLYYKMPSMSHCAESEYPELKYEIGSKNIQTETR